MAVTNQGSAVWCKCQRAAISISARGNFFTAQNRVEAYPSLTGLSIAKLRFGAELFVGLPLLVLGAIIGGSDVYR